MGLIALFQQSSSTHMTIDIIVYAGLGVIGVLGTIVGHFAWKRMSAYDKHLEECHNKAVVSGQDEVRLALLEKRMDGYAKTVHWLGDCMMTIGAKLDVQLPPRPERS